MAVPREKDIVTTQQKNDLRGKEDDDEGREKEREKTHQVRKIAIINTS